MIKHSPGPWERGVGQLVVSADRIICDVATGNVDDIRAIAAVPELVEAMRNFIGFAEYHEMEKQNPRLQLMLAPMRAALAKAGI